MTWDAELADEEDVERCPERRRDLEPDGDAAAWQSQHDDVVTIGIGRQCPGEVASGFNAIFETHVFGWGFCGCNAHARLCRSQERLTITAS